MKDGNIINFEGLKFRFLQDIDTYESFMKRLYDLYKEGMREYLKKEIIDYSDHEVLTLLNSKKNQKIKKSKNQKIKKSKNFRDDWWPKIKKRQYFCFYRNFW